MLRIYRNLTAIILIVLVFIGGAIFFIQNSLHVKSATGVIVTLSRGDQQLWGLREDFRIFQPFAPRTLRISNSQDVQQYEGKRVRLQYETVDVIGTDDFSVVVRPVRIEPL